MESTWWFVASPDTAALDVVRAVSPLALDLLLACGPVWVPLAVSAMDATLEDQDTAPARILRSFLRNNPWEGMGSVTADGWMLVADGDEAMVFAQRHDRIGLGPAVTMSRRDWRGALTPWFQQTTMGGGHHLGIRPTPDDPDPQSPTVERPEPVFQVRVEDRGSTLLHASWHPGGDPAGVAHRVHTRTLLVETAREVHFLLITAPHPEYHPRPRGGRAPGRQRRGPARRSETSFELAAPLGDRVLFSDHDAPATRVHVLHATAP